MSKIKNWQKGTGSYKVGELAIAQTPFVLDSTQSDNTSNWTKTDCTATFNSEGYYNIAYTADTQYLSRMITALTQNKRYRMRFDIKSDNSTVNYRPYVHSNLTSSSGDGLALTLSSTWTTIDYSFNASSAWINFGIYSAMTTGQSYQVRNISLTEIPPLPTITTDTKYLENTTAGTTAIQSSQAYGEWEWDVYKGADVNSSNIEFCAQDKNDTSSANAYEVNLFTPESIRFTRRVAGGFNSLFQTANSYISNNTWYRLKVARLQSEGVFKDIPTLQVSDCENSVTYPYDSFTSNGRYGFSVSDDGFAIAGTNNSIDLTNTAKYLIEFDLKQTVDNLPYLEFRKTLGGATLSDSVKAVDGRNSIILTCNTTWNDATLNFKTLSGSSAYEVSGLTIRRIYPADTFAVFIKGGSFGDDWTLVDTTGGSGTNPVVDATYTTSEYFVADLDAGDRLANLKITNGVKQ